MNLMFLAMVQDWRFNSIRKYKEKKQEILRKKMVGVKEYVD